MCKKVLTRLKTSVQSSSDHQSVHQLLFLVNLLQTRYCECTLVRLQGHLWRVPGREFRFLAPTARQHLFLNLNQLILWRRIRICLLSFRQSCECCQTNGFARPVLRDWVSMTTKVTCEIAHTKVYSFCPHFRLFCSIIINFSKIFFCSPTIEVHILNRG